MGIVNGVASCLQDFRIPFLESKPELCLAKAASSECPGLSSLLSLVTGSSDYISVRGGGWSQIAVFETVG